MNGTSYVYPDSGPMNVEPYAGLIIIVVIILLITLAASWPSITEWFNKNIRYRYNTIKSFIICQKSPDIDLKKIYKVVDDANDFLRGKTIKGITVKRKKINTKNLISISSLPGEGCYYFIIWYKDKG